MRSRKPRCKIKTAYIIYKNAIVGNSFKIKTDKWTIKKIGLTSVSRGILEKIQRVDKI